MRQPRTGPGVIHRCSPPGFHAGRRPPARRILLCLAHFRATTTRARDRTMAITHPSRARRKRRSRIGVETERSNQEGYGNKSGPRQHAVGLSLKDRVGVVHARSVRSTEKKPIELRAKKIYYRSNGTALERGVPSPPPHRFPIQSGRSSNLSFRIHSWLNGVRSGFPKPLRIKYLSIHRFVPRIGNLPALPPAWARFEWMSWRE
jgi:hypothetical protein